MKKATALKSLIDYMEENYHLTEESRMEFRNALKEERMQLLHAHNAGIRFGLEGEHEPESNRFDRYFNKTYNNSELEADKEKNNEMVKFICHKAGIEEPTERHISLALQAAHYADPALWINKPLTIKEWVNHRRFEIKAFYYFMESINSEHELAPLIFRECETKELEVLEGITNNPIYISYHSQLQNKENENLK